MSIPMSSSDLAGLAEAYDLFLRPESLEFLPHPSRRLRGLRRRLKNPT